MRITVGHLLILTGLGGAGWWAISKQEIKPTFLSDQFSSVSTSFQGLMDLFKSGAQGAPLQPVEPVETPLPESSSEKEAATEEKTLSPATPLEQEKTSSEDTVKTNLLEPVAAKENIIVSPAASKKRVTRPRRSPKKKSVKTDQMMGRMVTLTLNTGRDVQGILTEKTATSYVIEMPGMGPFNYEISKVTRIKLSR